MRCTVEFSVSGSSHKEVTDAANKALVTYANGDETILIDASNMEIHVTQDENRDNVFHANVFVRINS
jgi:hypothetical protein